MYWYMSKLQFVEWLQKEIEIRGITLADVAKRGEVSPTTIWRIANGERNAGIDSILAIAQGLRMSPVEVFRIATNQPSATENPQTEQLVYLFQQLDARDRQTILDMMEFLLSKG